ncbi:MAG: DNA double-strand break repair nuclease NurA [Chloroflexi bacterium]|nr:DNA double-strand break repair nuclease NurA [Chloroflexota bacterium]
MALQFDKLEAQIVELGKALAERGQAAAEELRGAIDLLSQLNDLDAIWEQIKIARRNDAGFRGAAPFNEPINQPIPLPALPPRATLFAADGSQIYPDLHAPAPYWLANIGVFIYHHGTNALPEMISEPQLFFGDEDVRAPDGQLLSAAAINARRTVYELQFLAKVVSERQESVPPLVAMCDGPLLHMPFGKEIPDAKQLEANYHEAFDFLIDAGAALLGYVDRPSSRFVLYTLYLMTLPPEEITAANLARVRLEGMTDADLYKLLLPCGARSGMMVQQSPLNKDYKDRFSPAHEIIFFYLNTAAHGQAPYLARVEIPQWVARDKELVDAVHALVYDQCQIADRYPYALTRADEIAAVQPADKRALDERIAIELLRHGQPVEISQKLSMKWRARYGRWQGEGAW